VPLSPARFLSPCAVARRLGVRDAAVYGWIKAGELPAADLSAKLGPRPRYKIDPADLDTFLERRKAGAVQVEAPRRRTQPAEGVIQFY